MGGVILLLILLLLVAILLTPAIRARLTRKTPPEDGPTTPHEVVVHRLDDHRKAKSAGDDTKK